LQIHKPEILPPYFAEIKKNPVCHPLAINSYSTKSVSH
jgi:hypothetical protein